MILNSNEESVNQVHDLQVGIVNESTNDLERIINY